MFPLDQTTNPRFQCLYLNVVKCNYKLIHDSLYHLLVTTKEKYFHSTHAYMHLLQDFEGKCHSAQIGNKNVQQVIDTR